MSLSPADRSGVLCRFREKGWESFVGRAERCLGRRYMAHAINASRAVPYEEYRDCCGNFTRNGKLNDQHQNAFLVKGRVANTIFSNQLVCTPKNRTADGDYKCDCSRRPWRLAALKRNRVFEVRGTESDFFMEFGNKMEQRRYCVRLNPAALRWIESGTVTLLFLNHIPL